MIAQGQCTIFKQNLLKGLENFNTGTPYVYKMALYTALADLNSSTLAYTSVDEIVGTGYVAGGLTLTPIAPALNQQDNTAYISFQTATWIGSSFTARGALIYNSTTGAAVCVLDFGSDKTMAPFVVTFPTATSTTAIIRIS
jgi:hypothetical protein